MKKVIEKTLLWSAAILLMIVLFYGLSLNFFRVGLEISFSSPQNGQFQVYYYSGVESAPFDEQHSVIVPFSASKETQTVRFKIPQMGMRSVRLDIDDTDTVEVASLTTAFLWNTVAVDMESSIVSNWDDVVLFADGHMNFQRAGDDPQILFTDLEMPGEMLLLGSIVFALACAALLRWLINYVQGPGAFEIVKNETGRELCLDGVRGIGAVIIAFFWHYWHFPLTHGVPMQRAFSIFYEHGQYAVELFFMLSGFGMMMGYGDQIREHKVRFKTYFSKRISKVYPLFFLTLLMVTGLELLYKAKMGDTFVYPNFDIYHLVLNLLCIQDGFLGSEWSFNSPSWCVSVCLFCYILFYYIAYRSKSRSEIYYRILAVGLIGTGILASGLNYPTLWNFVIGRGLCCFSIGVALFGIYDNREKFNSVLLGHVFITTVIGIVTVWYLRGNDIFGNIQWTVILAVSPMAILAVLFVPWLKNILSRRPFVELGKLSFDIYLLHFPVQCLIRVIDLYCGLKLDYSSIQIWALYAACVIGISWVFERAVNKPFRAVMRKIWLKPV